MLCVLTDVYLECDVIDRNLDGGRGPAGYAMSRRQDVVGRDEGAAAESVVVGGIVGPDANLGFKKWVQLETQKQAGESGACTLLCRAPSKISLTHKSG
jgi:hypothetical protein